MEHAATVTMQIADAYVTDSMSATRCSSLPRYSVVLCRSYNDKLKRRGGSRFAVGRAASGALEEEETRASYHYVLTILAQIGSRPFENTYVGNSVFGKPLYKLKST